MADPEVLLERYELRGLIGAGGSARVFRAHDRVLDRTVAVKVLDSAVARSADPASHQRFLREGRSSARFSHPHAVAVYDAGDHDGQLFMVMEYVDGGSLAERIAADAPIADRHVVRVGTQLLSALGAAHTAGLVHRDVKPANVLLDRSGTVKLADFGIARRFDEITSALTVEGMVVGTRAYLAPEQARGDDVGLGADIYAVGATLFEMATGERPPMTPIDAARGADPRTLVPAISPAVASTISRALAGRPEQRFESAEAMAEALRGEHPAMVAPPPTAVATPVAASQLAPTAAMPAATTAMPAATTARTMSPAVVPSSPRRRWWPAAVVVLLTIGAVVTVLALGDLPDLRSNAATLTTDPGAPPASTTPASTVAATITSTAAPTTVPPTTVPPTTAPPTTVPPTTVPPTTAPPAELMPGFPDTDDIEQFIDQLRDRSSPAGKQSKKLGDGLRDVLGEDDDRDEEIDDLTDEIDEWVEKDEIDPAVAGRALEFLAEIARGDIDD